MENKLALQEVLQALDVKHLSPEQVTDIIKLAEFAAAFETLRAQFVKFQPVAHLVYASNFYDMIDDVETRSTNVSVRICDYIGVLIQTSQDNDSTN